MRFVVGSIILSIVITISLFNRLFAHYSSCKFSHYQTELLNEKPARHDLPAVHWVESGLSSCWQGSKLSLRSSKIKRQLAKFNTRGSIHLAARPPVCLPAYLPIGPWRISATSWPKWKVWHQMWKLESSHGLHLHALKRSILILLLSIAVSHYYTWLSASCYFYLTASKLAG